MSEETKSQSPAPVQPETSKCKYCKQEIPREASKCYRCGEYQNKLRLLVFLPYVIPSVIVLLSIFQLILACIQTKEAHKKNIDASNALRIAVSASEDVNKASVEAKRMVTEIKTILDGTEKKVDELDRSIQDGNRAITELKLLTQFNTVVISAQADNRDAFDILWTWAEDASFSYQQVAIQTRQKILDESYTYYRLLTPVAEFPWREGLDPMDPNRFPLSNLWTDYKSAPKFGRYALVRFVWEKRRDISRKERLQFLADVLKEDKSLEVCKLAGFYFSEDTGDGCYPLAIKGHLEWWEKNKETIK